jgi:hypothetical protein
MAKEKTPRSTPSKRTTTAKPKVPSTSTPYVMGEPTIGTAQNTIIQGEQDFDFDEVRKRAYELYEERGRLEGHHEADWHRAESELRNRANGKNTKAKKKSA